MEGDAKAICSLATPQRGPNESSATVDTDLLCSAVSAQGAERDEEALFVFFLFEFEFESTPSGPLSGVERPLTSISPTRLVFQISAAPP